MLGWWNRKKRRCRFAEDILPLYILFFNRVTFARTAEKNQVYKTEQSGKLAHSMDWIHHYQLFLFDFDGLLVNTEMLHYEAYRRMINKRGFTLNWDLPTYFKAACFDATGLKKAVYNSFPKLYEMEPNWDVLYAEKKKAYLDLLNEGKLELMPGIDPFLHLLAKENKKRCVVTHSPQEQIETIVKQLPVLSTITHWITRENYTQPKPHPECYQKAIALHAAPQDRVIGFEDSPRGLKALLGSSAEAVLVSSVFDKAELATEYGQGFKHVLSFESLL